MESLSDFSLEVTLWLQANYPQLETLLASISALGRIEFYLAVIPLIYWCLHKQLGIALTYLLVLADFLNAGLKHAFRDPRPYWTNPEAGLRSEEGYGFPSGHTQGAVLFYILLAAWVRERWLWLLAAQMVFLVALSRLYLGVHDIADILAGIFLGAAMLLGFFLWRRYLSKWYTHRILGQRLLIALSVPMVLVSAYIILLFIIGPTDLNEPWKPLSEAAERANIEFVARASGALLGLSIGFVLESSRVRFLVDGSLGKRILRYLLGISITVIAWLGLGYIFPSDPLWLAIPLRVLRYFLVALWLTYYAPMTFVRLRLCSALPEPEISISL